MDIQREREAFELVVANQLQNSLYHSVFFNEATGRYDCADDATAEVQVFCCDLNSDLRIWKAAKTQAVPEGFVVVPKEPTQELLNKMQDFFVGAFENGLTGGQSIHCAYIAMVEAQERANESE